MHVRAAAGVARVRGSVVPLSEDEQRILHQIEQQFYESDPEFARTVSETTIYRHAFRQIKLAVVGMVVGLAFILATLQVSYWVAFGGFVLMLLAAIHLERNARKLGRAGLQQVTRTLRGRSLKDAFGTAGQRMRERFKKDD